MSEIIPGKPLPYPLLSTRNVDDVLAGEDVARPLLEASLSGDVATLQNLLSQPKWIMIMLDSTHVIYEESRPRVGPDDAREVKAHREGNFDRAFKLAVQNHHAAILTALMTFSNRQGIMRSDFIAKPTMSRMIADDYDWVWEALAIADPEIVHYPCMHGTRVLYEAVKRRQPCMVQVLLKYGADPQRCVQEQKKLGTFNSSLMSIAAKCHYPRILELLLEYGVPIAHTSALHTAAAYGCIDTMRVLIQHGADLNEVDQRWCQRTPMHLAAERCEEEAMKFLEDNGARTDVLDYENQTPAQLLEVMKVITARREQEREALANAATEP